ncbi:LOW QUALITY PROTEIN: E3 ubiquitin-protein ligase parkin-like [Homarus americanus]|uniref:LOW QUALITY PROTEIN: E3 ubiquitin-protein ligase parkin-like n=1 Tax=Homarus americanus TaxID=6706 RepID=UPI001C44DF0C|nr:LOW QUALITY PROTEIN: E3 ubiquitin-protein ligase parkin-like [Homarus americanus]
MLGFLFDFVAGLWQSILAMFGFGRSQPAVSDRLEVFVRTNTGEKVSVCLDPSWTVEQIKTTLAPKLNSSYQDLRIIFAGKELPNEMVIRQCDLGNRSVLHAVKVVSKDNDGNTLKSIASTSSGAVAKLEYMNEDPKSTGTIEAEEETEKSVKESQNKAIQSSSSYPEKSAVKETRVEDGGAAMSPSQPTEPPPPGIMQTGSCGRLLCDASTVMTIQMTEAEQKTIRDLKTYDGSGERPHFYVYCVRPCNSVQVGKLRVRCASCKQGALTLHRDPCNWQDVLNPGQISATCETLGCNGSKAEFFFKCRGHETSGEDDTSVALYLVRANLPAIPCLACTDVSHPVVVFECVDAHVMCLDCFVTFCVSRLSERQFIQDPELGYTLSCPIGCQNSFIREVHHFKLMGDNHYERYQRWGTEEAVLAVGGVLCPYPGCGQGIIPDQDCRRVVCMGGCGYVFCRLCLQGYHIGECHPEDGNGPNFAEGSGGFAVDPSRAASSRWDEATSVAIRVTTKPCPKCRTPTERDGGCMHMVCTRGSCGFHWCWVCQTEWTRECMAAHWFG